MSENKSLPSIDVVKPNSKVTLDGEVADIFTSEVRCLDGVENKKNILSSFKNVDAHVIDDFMTIKECKSLCDNIDRCNELSFWSSSGRENEEARSFRDADTIEMDNIAFATLLWNRMHGTLNLPDILISDDDRDNPMWERELAGRWVPVNFNHNFLFARYPSGGHFAPHTDGRAIHDFNYRSFYSVIIYLNIIPNNNGGGTRFYQPDALHNLHRSSEGAYWTSDPNFIIKEIEPMTGRILIFHQSLVHEGIPPRQPFQKYIIRSDIMYERTPRIFERVQDIMAYKMVREAELIAEKGSAEEAIKLFRKAFRVSPELAHFMGH